MSYDSCISAHAGVQSSNVYRVANKGAAAPPELAAICNIVLITLLNIDINRGSFTSYARLALQVAFETQSMGLEEPWTISSPQLQHHGPRQGLHLHVVHALHE